jgi:hypothetical protein
MKPGNPIGFWREQMFIYESVHVYIVNAQCQYMYKQPTARMRGKKEE